MAAAPLAFFSGLIMGTGSTLTIKVVYDLNGTDSRGNVRPFEKPLTTTWVMFLAMAMALPLFAVVQCCSRCSRRREGVSGVHEGDLEKAPNHLTRRLFFLLAVPALFDLVGTALAKVGLLYTPVSVYQLVRCTVIIITALLKVCVLRQKLRGFMWAGILLNTVAMGLVSSTSFLGATSADGRDPRIGIFFILASCLVQGLQYVFEEKVMHDDGVHPLLVVGLEGFWGAVIMALVVFPWAYIIPGHDVGSLENLLDSWHMMRSNPMIQWVLLGFFGTVALYNIFSIYVTHLMSSIWHAILDNFRPVSVWGVDLLIFYTISHGSMGEQWSNLSYLQLAGMLILFIGTAVFNGNVRLPCFTYETQDDTSKSAGDSDFVGLEESNLTESLVYATPPTFNPNGIPCPHRRNHQVTSPMLNRSPFLLRSVATRAAFTAERRRRKHMLRGPMSVTYGAPPPSVFDPVASGLLNNSVNGAPVSAPSVGSRLHASSKLAGVR